MKMEEKRPLTFLLAVGLLIVGITPAFAEVIYLETDYAFYGKNDQIKFSGTVEKDSVGLVTIVIRDPTDKFVLLTQVTINPDNTFERKVMTEPKITVEGTYNATAFIINMTAGSMVSFDYALDTLSNSIPVAETNNERVIISEPEEPLISSNIDSQIVDVENSSKSKLANFVDPTKDPQYYIDRYNNEDLYRKWFDNNYPNLTIKEAVGYEKISTMIETQDSESKFSTEEITENIEGIISPEIIPDAQASTIVAANMPDFENNSELTSMILALGGLAVLLGAVYGIKLKVDNNAEQISKNRATIKKKLLSNILHHDPFDVIRDRLAKGEISVEEYYKVKNALRNE